MRVTLTYEGPLRSSQRDPTEIQKNPLARHKHEIRRHFHYQLRNLWTRDQFLSGTRVFARDYPWENKATGAKECLPGDVEGYIELVKAVAWQHQNLGYSFVPLVRSRWSLFSELSVLLLWPEGRGNVVKAGDLDNRIKTLIDSLRCPKSQNELVEDDRMPRKDEEPFFCLLEDDSLVSRLSVDTDRLLDEPLATQHAELHCRLFVTAQVRAHYVTMFNLSLIG